MSSNTPTSRTRGRLHVLLGALTATAVMVGAGLLVHNEDGAHPTLADRPVTGPIKKKQPSGEAARPALNRVDLVDTAQVGRLARGRDWKVTSYGDNTQGDGLLTPCQRERFADPEGAAGLVRTFGSTTPKGKAPLSVTQFSELSDTVPAARTAFQRSLNWYAGCQAPHFQLLDTRTLPGTGDDARLFVLRSTEKPVTTYTVAVARTGRFITSTIRREESGAAPVLEPVTSLLSASVNNVCGDPGTTACAAPPTSKPTAPLPVGKRPALLDVVDLPVVAGVSDPWSATDPTRANINVAATRCDDTTFTDGFESAYTRTYLFPEAQLPSTFGLTETVGRMQNDPDAAGFVDQIREDLGACADQDVATSVDQVLDRNTKSGDLAVWHVTTEVSDDESVEFWMAAIRRGSAVAQLGFVPSDGASMSEGDFVELTDRATQRLAYLPEWGEDGRSGGSDGGTDGDTDGGPGKKKPGGKKGAPAQKPATGPATGSGD